eukprot:m.110350 g.110350  ORF g.110350 m.110350 type:complete len:287 (+) comp28031_c0_seq2:149-1009(+)
MRWKAKIDNAAGCIGLQRIVGTFARLTKSKETKLRLTPTKIFLVELGDSEEQAKIWCEIDRTNLFQSYKIESAHENNEILVIVNVEQLSRALKSTVAASTVTFKLSRRDDINYLSLIIGTKSVLGSDRPIAQDVPVLICHHSDIEAVHPPDLATPEINVYLPSQKMLRNVVERMKALSDFVVISANGDGEVTLKIETSILTVKTFFKDLQNAEYKDGEQPADDEQARSKEDFVDATVSVRSLFLFIAAHQVEPPNMLLSIVHGQAVVLHVALEDTNLTFYIPVHLD